MASNDEGATPAKSDSRTANRAVVFPIADAAVKAIFEAQSKVPGTIRNLDWIAVATTLTVNIADRMFDGMTPEECRACCVALVANLDVQLAARLKMRAGN